MKLIFASLLSLLTLHVIGQEVRLNYANELLDTKSYYYAAEAYEDVLERGIDSTSVAPKIALAYDKAGNYQKARDWYAFMYKNGLCDTEQTLTYVLLEKRAQNYSEANSLFNTYLSTKQVTPYDQYLALNFNQFEELAKDKGDFTIQLEDVNTENSEIGTTYLSNDQVLFSRNDRKKVLENKVHAWTGSYFYHLFTAEIDKDGNLSKIKAIKSDKQSKYHDGPGVYYPALDTYYITRNNYKKFKKKHEKDSSFTMLNLQIYTAQIEDGKLNVDKNLSKINSSKYSTCHPTLDTVNNRLIFASDRPGGYGGMDLYYVNLNEKGKIDGEPVNFGPDINTPEDEIFPHFNSKEQVLYFSSEGHIGLGGLDIYAAKLNDSYSTFKVENLGAPINSNADDFSFVDNQAAEKGYFSSDRAGDDNIYSFLRHKKLFTQPLVAGRVFDNLTKDTLVNTLVYLYNDKEELLDSTYTNLQGFYSFEVEKNEAYLIRSKDEIYGADEVLLMTSDEDNYKADLYLEKTYNYLFTGTVIDQETKKEIENVHIALIDSTGTPVNYEYDNITGHFIIDDIKYTKDDMVDFTFVISASNYFTRYIKFDEALGERQNLYIGGAYEIPLIYNENYEITELFSLNPIYFNFDKYNIRPDAAEELDKIVEILKEHPEINLYLQAHTDSRGTDAYNLRLSKNRAIKAKEYLVARGISADRLKIEYFGESKLYIPYKQITNAPGVVERERLHQLNRRVEFVIEKQ